MYLIIPTTLVCIPFLYCHPYFTLNFIQLFFMLVLYLLQSFFCCPWCHWELMVDGFAISVSTTRLSDYHDQAWHMYRVRFVWLFIGQYNLIQLNASII